MAFRSSTVLSQNEVELTFDGDDGTTVTHRFTIHTRDDGLTVTSADTTFAKSYTMVGLGQWAYQLALDAWTARHNPLPAGRRLDEIHQEAVAERKRRWDLTRRDRT